MGDVVLDDAAFYRLGKRVAVLLAVTCLAVATATTVVTWKMMKPCKPSVKIRAHEQLDGMGVVLMAACPTGWAVEMQSMDGQHLATEAERINSLSEAVCVKVEEGSDGR